ncbi:MAG: hypothetical protein H7A33_05795 [Deltaproteobacteria bacterium]|nr:hypothetical protein [Deltaproteobacteria bacterium]
MKDSEQLSNLRADIRKWAHHYRNRVSTVETFIHLNNHYPPDESVQELGRLCEQCLEEMRECFEGIVSAAEEAMGPDGRGRVITSKKPKFMDNNN